MRLYSGLSTHFIEDVTHNQIEGKLTDAFFRQLGHRPSDSERNSWSNSLRALSLVLHESKLYDHGVVLEYQLPLTSNRLDCLLLGRDELKHNTGVIIELKQWSKAERSDCENEVITWVGGSYREVLHPSFQVGRYQQFLVDTHTAFDDEDDAIFPHSCAYLHNYSFETEDPLLDPKFNLVRSSHPLFSKDMVDEFSGYLGAKLAGGHGDVVLQKFESGQYRASKKLLEYVGKLVKGIPSFILLDEQQIVYDKVLSCAKKSLIDRSKHVILIQGGPGTGKSVIAINLLADLALLGFNAHYATGSRAFTKTLRKIVGSRASIQFKYFNSYTQADYNILDVLIADEAHRLRTTSNSRFTKKTEQSDQPQIRELISAAKTAVFFIDDKQGVRPGEIGSSSYIKDSAQKNGCSVHEYELGIQFRCSGSEAFIGWVNNTLGIERTANVILDNLENFEVKIYGSPLEVENAIKKKVAAGYSGRMTAGFCWEWSFPRHDKTLIDDVIVGDYRRPWNARPDAGRLASGIPPSDLWAYDPNGINQVGCIYTAQGFEFDYIGVVFGNDLRYDFSSGRWIGDKTKSYDTSVKKADENFVDLVKNTYRVLMTRGMKGCYLYFTDKDTENFFRSRMG